ncbi:Mor family transcriptional regulator [Desulfomicrobium macestii]|uniref:Mor transcription activator family protein n=2 Tax=Desulfomicrobium TaxID=898 RepID=A0A8G2BZH8_DESNO|nr:MULTISPECIES: CD3324 family protein [Desulfomicrobium]MBE1423478.1 Mor family transcriptional regulator [Desulfomicrobium macestii]SFL25122.1 Mor transcription activator family protein [Desulfomicrobium norvegicum]
MGYTNATEVLPKTVLEAVQKYIDGQCVYIPRRDDRRQAWGERTQTRANIRARNREIRARHDRGMGVRELAKQFYLSPKTISKILRARTAGR